MYVAASAATYTMQQKGGFSPCPSDASRPLRLGHPLLLRRVQSQYQRSSKRRHRFLHENHHGTRLRAGRIARRPTRRHYRRIRRQSRPRIRRQTGSLRPAPLRLPSHRANPGVHPVSTEKFRLRHRCRLLHRRHTSRSPPDEKHRRENSRRRLLHHHARHPLRHPLPQRHRLRRRRRRRLLHRSHARNRPPPLRGERTKSPNTPSGSPSSTAKKP